MAKSLKVGLYALAKNEMKNLEEWLENMDQGLDYIAILDTGSTDGTWEYLQERAKNDPRFIIKQHIFETWAWDDARNMNLDMLPEDCDVCVCTDEDERWATKDWLKLLKKKWKKNTLQCYYTFNWKMKEDRVTPEVSFIYGKIHARNTHRWKYPVHEDILCTDKKKLTTKTVVNLYGELFLNHYPDQKKPRDYTPLIKLRVDRYNDSISKIYLIIAYTSLPTLEEKLQAIPYCEDVYNNPDDTLRCDRERAFCAYVRGSLAYYQNDISDAIAWMRKAIILDERYADPLIDLCRIYYARRNYPMAYRYILKALDANRLHIWVENSEAFETPVVPRLVAACAANLGRWQEALSFANAALENFPDDEETLKIKEAILKNMPANNQ